MSRRRSVRKSKDIVVVMITVDRRLWDKRNYLGDTLRNLERGGVFESGRLGGFVMVCSGGSVWPTPDIVHNHIPKIAMLDIPMERRCANENTAVAFMRGAEVAEQVGAEWVLFLEDDIDVCADFLGSVGRWLDRHVRPDEYKLYSFGANYPQAMSGPDAWEYQISKFYGTQALAVRREDAQHLSDYLMRNLYSRNKTGTAYDLLMHRWALETWPQQKHFLACSPSFVQHIGKDSAIKSVWFTFPSWPGREWSYE